MTTTPRDLWNRVRRVWTGSIQRRLTLGITVLLAAVMSVFVFDLVNRQDDFLRRQDRDEARALAQTLAANSVSWVLASDLAGLQEVIRTVRYYPALRYAMVLSRDGRVLAHTDASLVGRYADDAISRSLAVSPRTAQVLVSTESLVDIAVPIQENGTHIGWTRVSLSHESSRASLEAVARNGLVYAIIAIVLGALLSALLVRGLTRDLAHLVRATRCIGAGERGVQPGLAREDELGELSSAFNAMVSNLDDATRELRDSEEKFRRVSASAQDGVILMDRNGDVSDWNAAAQRMFGYPAAEVLGRNMHELLAPARYRAAYQQGLAHFGASGSGPVVGRTLELAALRRDGGEFPIELSVSAVQIRGQWHAIGIVRDITERKRTEDALRRSEASLKEAQRIANLGNWELDLASNRLTWTDGIYRIFEIDSAKFGASYEAFLDAIHPDDRVFVDKAYSESIRNRTPYDIEHRLLMKDGRVKYVNERCETIYDGAGRPLRSIGTVQDITVRKAAEEAFRERDAYIARLIHKSPLAMLVASGTEQHVDFLNDRFTELFGYTLEDMPDVAHWWPLAYPDEAYREAIKAEWTGRVTRAMESKGEIEPMEATVRCKDGSLRYIEFRLASVGTRNLVTFVDLTDRKQAEERQRVAALYARSLIEASLDPLVTISPEGKVTDVNRMTEEATGVARNDLIGTDFADYFTEPEQARAGYRKVLAQGHVRDYPLSIRHRSGRTTDVLYNATVYRNEAGDLQGVFAAARDITERKRAADAIEKSEKRFHQALDEMLEGCMLLGFDWTYLYINDAAAQHGRQERKNLLGRTMLEMYPGVDRSEIFARYRRVMEERVPQQFEASFAFADGAQGWFEFSVQPAPEGIFVLSLDITERKRAEERQRAAALYARSLIEVSLDPLVTISPEGKVTDVNRMTEEATGFARSELIGSDFADYFTEPEQARAGYRQVLAQGHVRDYPLTIRHRAGRTTDVLYNATVYRNEAGELQGVFAAARDITERKQAEVARIQLAAIVQSSNDAIIGKDLDGNITSWNPGAERIYGYRADEVVGRPIAILAPEGRKKEISDFLAAVARGEVIASFETERVRKSGTRIDVSLALSPIRDGSGRIIGVSTIARDITEKKQAERALHKVNRALRALSHGNIALIHATDEILLMNEMCRVIVEIAGYRMAWVGYPEHDEGKTVRLVAQSGYAPDFTAQTDITWADTERGRGPLGIALRTGQIQVVQDVMTDERFEPWRTNAIRLGYGSVLVAPLVSGSQVIGALSINAEGAHAFDGAEIDLLSELAADMAFGIVTLRMRAAHEHSAQRVQRGMEETIGAIATTVEMRDPYTAGHQRRVAGLAVAIGRELGLAEERVHGLHLACVVHDLGKVHIPAEILSKPGSLNRIELELIKTHPEAGYEILKGVDFPWPIAQVVLQHHERLDGSGYPRGLKGGQILLEARILTVADVVEAMASHRPYRPSLGIEAALKEIETNAGKYYDPDVARACVALFREKGFALTEAPAAA